MSRISFFVLLALALAWLALGSVGRALPPATVVILAGPQQGTYDRHAHDYARRMREAGLTVEVRNLDDSLQIADRVNDPRAGVHIGFTAQAVDPKRLPEVASAGVVELQPLFVFRRVAGGGPGSPAALAGQRLVMPPPGSATAQAAREVLAQYGVTPENTRFTHLPIDQAARALQAGEHDAGFFMLAPSNGLIQRLAADPQLALLPFDESLALGRRIDFLRPALLARGAFDLRTMRPPQDVPLVGATVNVIVRADLHPAVLYALLNAMKDVHQTQSLVSDPGDYPSLNGTAFPLHPQVGEWAKTGTPWLFANLGPTLAGLVEAYWPPALFLLAVVSAFGTFRSLNEFIDGAAQHAAILALRGLQRRLDAGHPPGAAARALFRFAEPLILRENRVDRAREQLERLRQRLSG